MIICYFLTTLFFANIFWSVVINVIPNFRPLFSIKFLFHGRIYLIIIKFNSVQIGFEPQIKRWFFL